MKNKLLNLVFGLIFICGLGLMFYPSISNYYTQSHQSHVIETYQKDVEKIDLDSYQKERENAIHYNQQVSNYSNLSGVLANEKDFSGKKYEDLLDVGGIGVMGVLKIPSVNIELPIYHGTGQDELQVGVGHYRGSSLPIGGESTHTVLTGHRGLPSSRLLTDIDQLVAGDIFYVKTLKDTIAYEVDQIKTVLPEELDDINVVKGEDYCTLVTCTPYGINTHRLLVRGKRIAYVDLKDEISNEVNIFPMTLLVIIIGVLYMIVYFVKNKKRRHKK